MIRVNKRTEYAIFAGCKFTLRSVRKVRLLVAGLVRSGELVIVDRVTSTKNILRCETIFRNCDTFPNNRLRINSKLFKRTLINLD